MHALFDATRDLFEGMWGAATSEAAAPTATAPPARKVKQKRLPAPAQPAQGAIEIGANRRLGWSEADGDPARTPSAPVPHAVPPDQPAGATADASVPTVELTDALAPAVFQHPRASRQIRLGRAVVGYAFDRGKRRTIGFSVGPEGLAVRAPRWVALGDVDAALREKEVWILRKLQETRSRHDRLEAARIKWCDGAQFLFLGEPVVLRLDPTHAFAGVGGVLEADAAEPGAPRVLRLALARDTDAERIRNAAQAWLTRQARRLFIERLDHFALQLGVRWHRLSLSNAGTRWGSASADGSIRLNWRLIHFRLSVIDYVVAHELAHLRVMDHSPRFWDAVASVVPDHKALRRQLKDQPVPRW